MSQTIQRSGRLLGTLVNSVFEEEKRTAPAYGLQLTGAQRDVEEELAKSRADGHHLQTLGMAAMHDLVLARGMPPAKAELVLEKYKDRIRAEFGALPLLHELPSTSGDLQSILQRLYDTLSSANSEMAAGKRDAAKSLRSEKELRWADTATTSSAAPSAPQYLQLQPSQAYQQQPALQHQQLSYPQYSPQPQQPSQSSVGGSVGARPAYSRPLRQENRECNYFNGAYCERQAATGSCAFRHPPLGVKSTNYAPYNAQAAASNWAARLGRPQPAAQLSGQYTPQPPLPPGPGPPIPDASTTPAMSTTGSVPQR